MACSLKTGLCVSGSNETSFIRAKSKPDLGLSPNGSCRQFTQSISKADFLGKPLFVPENRSFIRDWNARGSARFPIRAESSICVSRALRWWEKFPSPNMIEIHSAQELVGSLLSAGDRLVVVDFYSPGCGGCKALHPKICQLAESNPNAVFLKVNYEDLKKTCHSLHIHVLPFFRFYRGAEGRLCSFSCTNATIKKFKDALAKHGTERCNLGPAKGLEESELMSLASMGEGSINLPSSSPSLEEDLEGMFLRNLGIGVLGKTGNGKMGIDQEEKGAMLLA